MMTRPTGSRPLLLALLVVTALLASSPAQAQDPSAPPLPGGWSVEKMPAAGSVAAVSDAGRTGSIRITHPELSSTTVVSEPVSLRVGHLYRLRGWIKTEGVRSDPTARYPTAVPACLTMASFPFTNHSPTVGGDRDWTRIDTLFIATRAEDRMRLHLGLNGGAAGTAWFAGVEVEKVEDVGQYVPPATVRWLGDAYRYDDRGWIFVHLEGEPYQRGYQFGYLVADEIVEYVRKLGVGRNESDPEAGWEVLRFATDAMLLRKYDDEYLTEMRGIADGAAHAEAELWDREIDLLDVVTINSVVDLGQMRRAMPITPHGLTGQSFLAAEDEMRIANDELKCSAFAATGPATASGEVVFGQIFMWSDYTGVHWNVICDLVPSRGHRLVYHTFPGGIHSGADFYVNAAGIVIGETTVSQTPYEAAGTPQSNRIRKAAQYASSIDEVTAILWEGNNGMYTNDWPIADVKTGEVAILLLGTHAKKLWRSSENPAPFGTPGFLWANNNNRDPEVRKEYVAQPHDAPFDLMFSPWNRDLAFNRFYQEHRGRIDAIAAVNLWATSPINRAHACDGKITTSEMARELVFLAHHGKVTLREKIPGTRRMPDLPGAVPHLSLGYSVPSPIFLTEKLKEAKTAAPPAQAEDEDEELDLSAMGETYRIDDRRLWRNTFYPASAAEGWLISGTAAYWQMLRAMAVAAEEEEEEEEEEEKEEEKDETAAAEALADELARITSSYLYTVSREEDLVPVEATRAYDRYGPYRIPRIKGTVALHQLRLLLGNDAFLKVMNAVHDRFARREITTDAFIATAEEVAGRPLGAFIRQWIGRRGLPELRPEAKVSQARRGGWDLEVTVAQEGEPYHLLTSVEVLAGNTRHLRPLALEGRQTKARFHFAERPVRMVLNPFFDFPVAYEDFYTWGNFIDDFHHTLIVYGTSRQIEANHTLARRWQTTVADAYVEILPPVVKDSEVTAAELASHDLMVLGHPADNSLTQRLAPHLPVEFEKNLFRWQGKTYAEPDDGLLLVVPNPYNPQRVLYLIVGNSALELYRMTRTYRRGLPSWVRFKKDEVEDEGFHHPPGLVVDLAPY